MRKQKTCIFILISVIVLMMFSSCGSSSKSSDMYEQQPPLVQENKNQPKNDSTGANNPQTSEGDGSGDNKNSNRVATKSSARKLIKNVNLEIETKEFDKLTPSLEKQISLLGGYVETSELTGKSYDDNSIRRGSMVARIPNQKLDEFVSSISTLGNILSKNQNTKDVTKDYVDTESHKKALLIEQDRLLALLEKTTNLENIITLEQRLSDVRFQLESFESQLRTYDDLVEYSTVTIKYEEVERITKIDQKSTWSKMSSKFLNSLTNVSNGFKNFLINFIGNIPYLILLAILVIIIFFIAKKIRKNEKINKAIKTKNENLKEAIKAKKDEFILKDDNKSEQ